MPILALGHLPPYLLGRRLRARCRRGARRHCQKRSPSRSGSASKRRRAASLPSSTTTWSAPFAWCRWSAATTRATSRCCRSAGRVRCTAARWPACSACRTIVVPPAPGVLSALGLLGLQPQGRVHPHLPAKGRRLRCRRGRARVRKLLTGRRAPGSMQRRSRPRRAALSGTPACATSTRASSSPCPGAAMR